MPQVMRRYYVDTTLVVDGSRLLKASDFKRKLYKKSFIKPNPYTPEAAPTQPEREALLNDEVYWTGYEGNRSGMGDLRLKVLRRDNYTCQRCGKKVNKANAEVDHKKPVARFKDASNAHRHENLQTYCKPCHKDKTKSDRQVESRVR